MVIALVSHSCMIISHNTTIDMDILGTWDWSALKVSGGSAGAIAGFSGIKNFSL